MCTVSKLLEQLLRQPWYCLTAVYPLPNLGEVGVSTSLLDPNLGQSALSKLCIKAFDNIHQPEAITNIPGIDIKLWT